MHQSGKTMKNLALLFSIIVLASGICLAQTSAFTYQGKLGDGGTPANGTYQFECKLFDGSGVIGDSGTQIGPTQTVVALVQNGIFTMQLDFGAASFAAGQNRWLEIGVRLNNSNGAYTVFDPRQQINSVPFALRSLSATTATTAINADNATKLAGVNGGNYVQTSDTRLSDARTPTAGSTDYVQNSTAQTIANFNIAGTGTASVLNAGQYNILGNQVLSTDAISWNLFAGVGAGQNNTAGCCNSFFGSISGDLNTGAGNSFFGAAAGSNNQGGGSNTFVGYQAGSSATSGNGNTIIGYNAGWTNTSENYNTFIGYQANAIGGFGITNATALGNQAVVTQSNSLVLGSINGVGAGNADTNVGIGTTNPAARLQVKGAGSNGAGQTDLRITGTGPIASGITLESTGTGGRTYSWLSTADNIAGGGSGPGRLAVFDVTAGSYRMVIDGAGNVGIGTFSPDQTLTVNGTADKPGGGSWLAFSDERLKNIKGRFTPGLKALMQLQPLRYEYKPDNALGLKSTGEHIGFGAQAVQKIIPEAVTKNESGYLLVNNDPIMWTMLNAIKEQQQTIEKLQQENRALKARNAETETRLTSLETRRSPNNSCWAVSVSDTGALSTTSVPCP